MFGQYDENGDGELDLAELAKYVVSINDYADTEDVEVWIYYLLFYNTWVHLLKILQPLQVVYLVKDRLLLATN